MHPEYGVWLHRKEVIVLDKLIIKSAYVKGSGVFIIGVQSERTLVASDQK